MMNTLRLSLVLATLDPAENHGEFRAKLTLDDL